MLKKNDSLKALRWFFKKNKMGKLADLFSLLDTTSRMSVFRRLRELHYISSYSHAGRYYTLRDIVDFDSVGLWFVGDVRFSQFGNLKETVFQLIEESSCGQLHCEQAKQQLSQREETINGWTEENVPDWIIVEILVSIIKSTQGIHIDLELVATELSLKKIVITKEQIKNILNQLGLKKTLALP